MNMPCPKCGSGSKVVDSRYRKVGKRIRRRRECLNCKTRFSTLEVEMKWIKYLLKAQLIDAPKAF